MAELNVRELLELERQIYQESIDRVLQQQEQLRDGVLEEFVRRCKPFQADRERELQAAQAQLQFSRRDARTLLEFELQQAEDVLRTDREQLKHKLLERVRRRRLRVQKRLTEKPPTSNIKQRREVEVAEKKARLEAKMLEKQLQRAQRRTRKSFNFRHLSGGVLPTPQRIVEDVVNECEKLQRNREREEAARMAEEEGAVATMHVGVSEDEQKLVCQGRSGVGETFCVGDAVVLMSRLTEEDFHGFVSAILSEEVQLVLVCGTHVRVALARLGSGQCTLHKQRQVVGPNSKRQDGQEEQTITVSLAGVATSLEELLQDPPDVRRRAAAVMNRLKRKTTIDIRRGF
ncbi:uncharacterized protein KRP23_10094 [Phytophthora ramorum]|uniref:uncharacterized protein n=1 Tax=Phytophthora ramorum TaxID=164328 RepID=UPI0030A03EFC|nr:hypothetical protein KRP23_10094 [Phytophthora ramorum]